MKSMNTTRKAAKRWSLFAAFLLPLGASAEVKNVPENGKLKIFILSGQSNMVGFGQVEGSPGTMETHVKVKPKDYGHLVDKEGKPLVRDDVWPANHWMRNWETYYLIGKGMGDAIVGLEEGSHSKPRIDVMSTHANRPSPFAMPVSGRRVPAKEPSQIQLTFLASCHGPSRAEDQKTNYGTGAKDLRSQEIAPREAGLAVHG